MPRIEHACVLAVEVDWIQFVVLQNEAFLLESGSAGALFHGGGAEGLLDGEVFGVLGSVDLVDSELIGGAN